MQAYVPEEARLGWAVAPGRLLQRELDSRGLSQATLATRTGLSTKHVNLVIKGHAPISPDVAISLEQILDVPAELWLTLEASFQAQEARAQRHNSLADFAGWVSNFPRDLLTQRGVVDAKDSIEDVVSKVLAFFQVTSPTAFDKTWLDPQASYKRSQQHAIDPYLTALWVRLAETKAELLLRDAQPFDAGLLKQVAPILPSLTVDDIATGFRRAQELLLSAGTALVFVPEISHTRICGVSRWVGGRPIIAVTSRYRWFDSFWFTLLHEVGHVLLHPKRSTYIDFLGKANDNADAQESAANEFAESTLIPAQYRRAVATAGGTEQVVAIARQLGISPGVVAGQHAFLSGTWGGPIAKLRTRGDLEDHLA